MGFMTTKKTEPVYQPPPEQAPTPETEAVKTEERMATDERKKPKKSSTILTGPQGLAGGAPTERKTLLGQ